MNFQVHFRPEPLLISDPSMYTVTYTVGANDTTQMNLTGCVASACNLSQALLGILTVVRKAILDSGKRPQVRQLIK